MRNMSNKDLSEIKINDLIVEKEVLFSSFSIRFIGLVIEIFQ